MPTRINSIDAVRGLSMIGIIIAHAYNSVSPIWLWGNGYAPMWFALLIGYSISLSRDKSPRALFARGVSLFVIGLVAGAIIGYVIMILSVLGAALIVTSWVGRVRRIHCLWIGGVILLVNPFATTFLTERFGESEYHALDIISMFSAEGWLSLLTGTYPLIEWVGLILVGYGLSSSVVSYIISPSSSGKSIAVMAISALSTALPLSLAFQVSQWSDSLVSILRPPTDMSFIERVFIPYGHSGSWVSIWAGISSFILVMVAMQTIYSWLSKVGVSGIIPLDVMGRYSLSAYLLSSFLIFVIGPSGALGVTAYLVVIAIVFILMYSTGREDPVNRLTKFMSRGIMIATPMIPGK